MIEETATSGYESTEEIPVMEVSISHGSVRRSRDTDVKSSGNGKRRRFGSEDEEDVFQLQYRSRRDVDVNFHENVVSTVVSGTSDHVNSSVMYSMHGDSISDLKAKFLSETDIFMSSNEGFSRETSTSSVVCLESEEMESSSISTQLAATAKTTAIEATSRRKPAAAETMPSAAELEEFFSKAEKYEQKRFAEKYNFDIVKDVPMEGRYQWVPLPLKP